MENIEVCLMQKPDTSYFIRVRLRSQARFGLISTLDYATGKRLSYEELSGPISVIGGALAEYQIEQYGDLHEPEECALVAMEALRELLTDLKQTQDKTQVGLGESINVH